MWHLQGVTAKLRVRSKNPIKVHLLAPHPIFRFQSFFSIIVYTNDCTVANTLFELLVFSIIMKCAILLFLALYYPVYLINALTDVLISDTFLKDMACLIYS